MMGASKLKPCDLRDDLLRQKDAAFDEWYAARSRLEMLIAQRDRGAIAEAKKEAATADKKTRRSQRAIIAHYEKHHCNQD